MEDITKTEEAKRGFDGGTGLAEVMAKTIHGIRQRYGEERAAECAAEVQRVLNGTWQMPPEQKAYLEHLKRKYAVDLIDTRDARYFDLEEAHAADCARCQGTCLHPGPYTGARMLHHPYTHDDGLTEAVFFVQPCTLARRKAEIEARRRAMHLSGLPTRFALATWKDVPARFAFAKEATGWLFLTGPHGCGKTLTAALIGQKALAMGQSVVYTSARELLSSLRPSSERSDERLWAVKEAELLILEDIGPERVTEWATERLGEILEYRQRELLRTVLTSRYPLARALGRYGPELVQRAQSMIKGPPITSEPEQG